MPENPLLLTLHPQDVDEDERVDEVRQSLHVFPPPNTESA